MAVTTGPRMGGSSRSWPTTVARSQLAPRLYGSLPSSMPIAQVLVSAAKVRPAPMNPAIHFEAGDENGGEDAGQHDRAGDEAYLTLQIPTGSSPVDRGVRRLPGQHATVQDRSFGRPSFRSARSAWSARAPERQTSTTSSSR